MTCTRPALRYHGGKWKLAPWIISHFGPHRVYVEPFGGGASVLLRKPRSYAEVYNDLDGEVVNLFRVLRHPRRSKRLLELLALTPFARDEFDGCYVPTRDSVELARRTLVRSFMGFGSAATYKEHATGFRANSHRSGTTPATDWANLPDPLRLVVERVRGIVIENRDALDVIAQHDAPDTLIYADPPYVFATRTFKRRASGQVYPHELDDDGHRRLAEVLRAVRGMVVLSGYACDLYDTELYPDWARFERATHADGARDRVEVLWLNPAAHRALGQSSLFDVERAA